MADTSATEPVATEAPAEPSATEAPAAEVAVTTSDAASPAAAAPATAAKATAAQATETEERVNRRKVREGIVVSDAMNATVIVAVVERVRHPRYGKTVQRTKRLYVHDADSSAKVGDRVRVVETRPLSKLKRWRLAEIMERAR